MRDDVYEALERLAESGLPPPGAAKLFDVGTSDYLDFFQREILDEFIGGGGATCRIFEGTYGAGKTHLLQLIERRALDQGMLVARTELSQSLQLDDWRMITRYVLEHCEAEIGGERYRSLPRILERLGQDLTSSDGLIDSAAPHPAFARAMHMVLAGDYPSKAGRELIHRFLLGERITQTSFKAAGVTRIKNPLSKKNAEMILQTLSAQLHRLGVPGVVLLFDENEKTLQGASGRVTKKMTMTANAMRRLIDAGATGRISHLIAIFAVLPDFLERAMQAYEALGQRIGRAVRLTGHPGWRSPVLSIEDINRHSEPEEFVRALAVRFGDLVDRREREQEFESIGLEVLQTTAGSDYRRKLIKRMAAAALEDI